MDTQASKAACRLETGCRKDMAAARKEGKKPTPQNEEDDAMYKYYFQPFFHTPRYHAQHLISMHFSAMCQTTSYFKKIVLTFAALLYFKGEKGEVIELITGNLILEFINYI